jgi:hypothetical protein
MDAQGGDEAVQPRGALAVIRIGHEPRCDERTEEKPEQTGHEGVGPGKTRGGHSEKAGGVCRERRQETAAKRRRVRQDKSVRLHENGTGKSNIPR